MDDSVGDLLDRYLRALDQGAPADQLWHLFLEHPWYRQKVQQCAEYVVRKWHLSREWLDDVKQDAMVQLREKLERDPDLHLDRELAPRTFPSWMHTIVSRDCLQAVLDIVRENSRFSQLLSTDFIQENMIEDLDRDIDIRVAAQKLSDDGQVMVNLYLMGYKFQAISDHFGRPYLPTYRQFSGILRQLARLLGRGLD